jgi:hypothetical protein
LDEPHSFAPLGRALRKRQHCTRQVDSYYCSVRRNCLGKLQYGLTPATTYVQDALTRVRRQRRQTAPAKRSQLQLQ